MNGKCPVCGKVFEMSENPRLVPKKYCSKECRAIQNQKNYWTRKIQGDKK